jgi:hypothetical protein
MTTTLGVRLSPDSVLLTGEALEAWKYDPDVALALETNSARLIAESTTLTLHCDGLRREAPSIANGGLRVEHVASKQETVLMQDGATRVRVRLAKRETDSNYALVRLVQEQSDVAGQSLLFATRPQRETYERVAVFHVTTAGKLDIVFLPAHLRGGRLVLDSPVDDSAFGSIVMGPDGIIGLVQDERSAMLLQADQFPDRHTAGSDKNPR